MGSSGKNVGYLVTIVVVCLTALVLTATSYGSEYWIYEDYYNATVYNNATDNTKPLVHINMGLFKGVLNNYFGVAKKEHFTVKDKSESVDGFINFALWITTIFFISLGAFFGLITGVFSIINSFTTPIEEITGIVGLYLWNNLACLFTLIGMLMYVWLYFGYLKYVLKALEEEIHWSIELPSTTGYSFFLIVGTAALYAINNVFIFLSTYKVDDNKQLPSALDKEGTTDGLIMLY